MQVFSLGDCRRFPEGRFPAAVLLLSLVVSACAPSIPLAGEEDEIDYSEGPGAAVVESNDPPPIPRLYAVGTEQIKGFIDAGHGYLIGVQHPELGGVYKYYYPTIDEYEQNLYTVYTASFAYTMLNLADAPEVPDEARRAGEFLLMMQNKKEGDARRGAFSYMYSLEDEKPEERYVVGTTSKSIYTLIRLHERTSDYKYLEAARAGGDWLLTMILPAGNVKPYTRLNDDGRWVSGSTDSTLYNGQVLSALSRLYVHTGDERYLEGARKIVSFFLQKVDRDGCYVGDGYRTPNPISSSWVLFSLMDFSKAQQDPAIEYLVLDCGSELVERQLSDESDLYRYGRWDEGYSTSGVGWVAEVMVDVHKFCQEHNGDNCDQYRDSVVRAIRWLMQNTYSESYVTHLPNPVQAVGGLFWSPDINERYVRTDSVCHALNAYIGILPALPEGTVLSLPN